MISQLTAAASCSLPVPYKSVSSRFCYAFFSLLLPDPVSAIILPMKPRTEKSMELYRLMLSRGYPEEFCTAVSQNLNTDFTAKRMLGYFGHMKHPSPEDVADEMLAILADRNAIMKKKEMEATQAKWNRIMAEGFGDHES